MFVTADRNRDQRMNLEEWSALRRPRGEEQVENVRRLFREMAGEDELVTLEEMIRTMARYQEGERRPEGERRVEGERRPEGERERPRNPQE